MPAMDYSKVAELYDLYSNKRSPSQVKRADSLSRLVVFLAKSRDQGDADYLRITGR